MKVLVLAALTTSAFAADCEMTVLSGLIANPNMKSCSTDSGYVFAPPAAAPTNAEMDKMCKSKNCQDFLSAVTAANPPECTVPVGGKIQLRSDLLDKVSTYCKSNGGASSGTTDKANSTTTGADKANSTTPSTDKANSTTTEKPTQVPTATTKSPSASNDTKATQAPTQKPTQKPGQKPAGKENSTASNGTATEKPKSGASSVAQSVALAVISVCLASFAF